MIAQTAARIRGQMAAFSGNVSEGLCKAARRFVNEAILGIQARQSVHLTEIGRCLNEAIGLIKTENRLSRNLGRPEIRPVVQQNLLTLAAERIEEETLLVLDASDIVKPYARKMENLARVRDGSAKVLANGYWLMQVIGVANEGQEITPAYGELYSQEADDFVSENEEMLKAINKVSRACDNRGVWVIDRGGDRGKILAEMVPPEKGRRFIIRLKGERHLLWRKTKRPALTSALSCPLPYATTIVGQETDQEKVHHLEYGFRSVRLPGHPKVPLYLVVVKGFGREPLMLLTNLPLKRNRASLWGVVSAYLTRWRIEETIRFAKQSYQVEDIRVLTYDRLRNMVTLVSAAMFFAAQVLGAKVKLRILAAHVLKASKRLFGIPDFRYYAIADGIKEILTRSPARLTTYPRPDPPHLQTALFDT